jgi:hypothetical protein
MSHARHKDRQRAAFAPHRLQHIVNIWRRVTRKCACYMSIRRIGAQSAPRGLPIAIAKTGLNAYITGIRDFA